MKQLLRNHSFTSIAKMFGMSDNAIRNWCKDYHLPYRSKEIKAISDKDWELV